MTTDRPPALIDFVLDELRAAATDAQVETFLATVGARIAARTPIASGPLDDVAAAMNRLWQRLGLGEATLTLTADGIAIDHRRGSGSATPSLLPLAPLLRGTYQGWFRSLGGGDALGTTIVRSDADRVELRHGL